MAYDRHDYNRDMRRTGRDMWCPVRHNVWPASNPLGSAREFATRRIPAAFRLTNAILLALGRLFWYTCRLLLRR